MRLSLIAIALLVVPAFAQDAKPAAAPCATPEYREFDFWIGDWDVRGPAGKLVGSNTIKPIHNGCVLFESWAGAGGVTGSSFNIYDASRKHWHQTWVDSSGSLLELDGGVVDGGMVLVSAASAGSRNRITWSVLPDGRVRQLWQTTSDGGATWKTSFDGFYEKKAKSLTPP
jgi:hypothetical protein